MLPEGAVVYGGGSWGTTLALHLARNGHPVRLWVRDAAQARAMQVTRVNAQYLPDFSLPDSIGICSGAPPSPAGVAAVIAVPSHAVRSLVRQLAAETPPLWVVATKGLEESTCLRMSQILHELAGDRAPIVVLTGPSLAREVAAEKPAVVLAASVDPAAALVVQRLFAGPALRVYTSSDVVGAELAGALKNVVALAGGMVDGLDLGQNARGALLTRGLAEIGRLGEALGARAETFLGLAGVGDLVTTATSPLSRNHALGVALAQGTPLAQALSELGMVAEGVASTRAALALAATVDVEMPISSQIGRILWDGLDARLALRELMTRPLRSE